MKSTLHSFIEKLTVIRLIKSIARWVRSRFEQYKLGFMWSLRKKGFWSRALLCWIISLVLLKFDEINTYDTRFKIRGPQPVNQSIILIHLRPSDMNKTFDFNTRSILSLNETNNLTDSYYWDQSTWHKFLTKILSQNPRSVGVTLYFGENLLKQKLNSQEILIFKDPRIIWSTQSQQLETHSLPFATLPDRTNIAITESLKDEDGLVRKRMDSADYVQDLAAKMTQLKDKKNSAISVINFRGQHRFQQVSFKKVIDNEIPMGLFKNKIVLIGVDRSTTSQITTPIGLLSKHEFWAHVIDNELENRFIRQASSWLNAGLLLALTIIGVLIITNFPHSVALFLFLSLSLLWSAFSIWIFDTWSVWIPLISPLVLLILIWVLYIGYHALKIEKAHNQLQQEQKYLADLEQLKNNFVSLISHDLKTPIAKIQAVVDRIESQKNFPIEFKEDFTNLKTYSEELNRYIQSILKVLRVESKDFKINKETADINGVIENVILRLTPLAQAKNIEIQLNLEPIFLIEFDVTLMTEVMLNLIENAIKYTPDNGLIQITTTETQDEVLVEIKDTGEGIADADQPHIWKKFVRGKNQDMKTKGSGLGLYLVKYFIELHGGNVQFQSYSQNSHTNTKGTTFYIRLPIDLSQ